MTTPDRSPGSIFRYPRYCAIGYQWNTAAECDFLEQCLPKGASPSSTRVLDIGCGAGRHMLELARRGYAVTGFDVRPEMVEFVREAAAKAHLKVEVSVGDLHRVAVPGTFQLAICVMDTFRFLLTNDAIIRHLQQVGERLTPGGLYVTDFWIPMRWDQMANEVYQWEQEKDETKVRVFYLQHPESIDPVQQTFEDQLVFSIEEGEETQEIQGERTRTRLLMPQEFLALVEASGVFERVAMLSDFDAGKPLDASSDTWRMITVLKKRD